MPPKSSSSKAAGGAPDRERYTVRAGMAQKFLGGQAFNRFDGDRLRRAGSSAEMDSKHVQRALSLSVLARCPLWPHNSRLIGVSQDLALKRTVGASFRCASSPQDRRTSKQQPTFIPHIARGATVHDPRESSTPWFTGNGSSGSSGW